MPYFTNSPYERLMRQVPHVRAVEPTATLSKVVPSKPDNGNDKNREQPKTPNTVWKGKEDNDTEA
ncbi:MAG: hypothetical protein EOM54_00085 [Clostridia bacterium]|nr:hypothetical protein [Clostridia bacterium]